MADVITPTPITQSTEKKSSVKIPLIVCGCVLLVGFGFMIILFISAVLLFKNNESQYIQSDSMMNNYGYNSNTIDNNIHDYDYPINSNTNRPNSVKDASAIYYEIQKLLDQKGYAMAYNEIKMNDLMTYSGYSDNSENYFSVSESESAQPTISVTTRADGGKKIDSTFLEDVIYAMQPAYVEEVNKNWIAKSIAAAEADSNENTKTISLDDGYMYFSYTTMEINDSTTTAVTVTITRQIVE